MKNIFVKIFMQKKNFLFLPLFVVSFVSLFFIFHFLNLIFCILSFLFFLLDNFLNQLISQKILKNPPPLTEEEKKVCDEETLLGILTPLNSFFKDILKHNEINLTKKLKPNNVALLDTADFLNFLLSSLGEIFSFFMENSERLSIFSSEIEFYTQVSKQKSEDQITYALEIINLIQKLLGSFKVIVMESQEAFKITDGAYLAYQEGQKAMDESLSSIQQLREYMKGTTQYLQDLQAFSKEVERVIKIILEMANKTNILSLNASIEAVRAGEAGRGFKVVAQEIQKFSQGTTDAGRQVSSSLSTLNEKMERSFLFVQQSQQALDWVTQKHDELKNSFTSLSNALDKSFHSTKQISDVAGAELGEIEAIDYKINHIQEAISDFKDDFILLSKTAGYITHTSENLASVLNHFHMEGFQTLARSALEKTALEIEQIWEEMISKKTLTFDDFFDIQYQAKNSLYPWRFFTRYDSKIEIATQKILENLKDELALGALEYGKVFELCFITDKNGYCPVHLKEFSKLPTGNIQKDNEFSLAKRKFDDLISKKAAKNTKEPLLQVYMKEAGIRKIDLSVPLRLQGKPWGCLRAQYNFF